MEAWAAGGRRYEALTPELCSYLYSLAAVGETVVMPTGARFTRVSDPNFDRFGAVWRDEATALTWSESVQGYERDQRQAEAFCRSHGARLPTRSEFEAWGRAMGGDRDGRLNHLHSGSQLGDYWSSSVLPDSDYHAFYFHGLYGSISYYRRDFKSVHGVRCVR